MKRFLAYMLILVVIINISGCWNKNELDELGIVQGLGIDQTDEGNIKITLQVLKPGELKSGSGGDSGNKGVWTTTSVGETLFEAIRNARAQTERKLFFSHNKVVIIGEDYARKGLIDILDFLRRDTEPRLESSVCIAKGTAEKILKAGHEQEAIPAEAILGLAESYKSTSMYPKDTKLLNLVLTLDSETREPFLAGVETTPSLDEKNKELIRLTDTAVFKDDKLVDWFSPKETRGILWITGDAKGGIIVLQPSTNKEDKTSIELVHAVTKLTPKITDDKLSMEVKINVKANVGEDTTSLNLLKPVVLERLNQLVEKEIIKEAESALFKAQDLGVDVFGFGEKTHKKLPREWPKLKENWTEEFKNLQVTIEVKAELSEVGRTFENIEIQNVDGEEQ